MPDHPAISALAGAAALALALTGCAQPGTQAPRAQAAKLAVGTGDISTACGYLEERRAFGSAAGRSVAPIESMAQTGAGKLAAVYARDRADIYQGESIGAVLGDSTSLLDDCRLTGPARTLQLALGRRR